MGVEVLPELVQRSAMAAAAETLPEVRSDDREALAQHRRLLPAGEQGLLGYVEGLNNKIRVIQRRAYGLRDEEYLRLKVLTCALPEI